MGEVVQVDDRSPLIHYNPSAAWIHSRQAVALNTDFEFYGGTTSSETWNANATFSFHGTGVQIHGVNNSAPLFGPYSVILTSNDDDDGSSIVTSHTGFQSPLYSNNTLPPGRYTVTLVVDGPYHVNVDHIEFTSIALDRNAPPTRWANISNDDAEIRWQPEAAWRSVGNSRVVTEVGASSHYRFSGNAVKIQGSLAVGSSYYTVQLDDRPPEVFNFNASEESRNLLLYYADSIGYQDHRISLISNSDVELGIDFFTVRGGADSNAENVSPRPPSFAPSPTPTAGGPNNKGPGFKSGILIGVLCAVFLILLPVLVFIGLHVRQRRQRRSFDRKYGVFKPFLLSRTGYTSLEGTSSTSTSDFGLNDSEGNHASSHGQFCSSSGTRSPCAQQHEKSRRNMSCSDCGGPGGRTSDRPVHTRMNSLGVECQSLPDDNEGGENGQASPPMRVINPSESQRCKSEESTFLHIMSPSRTHRAGPHHHHRIRRPSDASPASEFSLSPVCTTLEEDYAHLIVEGEPAPPDYWQATRKHCRVVGGRV